MRALTDAEKRADLLAINQLLNDAKDALALQITAAQRSAISRWLAGGALSIRLTRRMLRLLARLYRDGQSHAISEAAAMGVRVAAPPSVTSVTSTTGEIIGTPGLLVTLDGVVPARPVELLRIELGTLARKVEIDAADLAGASPARAEFARSLRDIAGAKNAASKVTSPAFHDGLASIYAPHHELFEGWQYSARLDSNACGVCVDEDGRLFETLQEARLVLPWFGGNPQCHGGTRCRCRLYPVKPAPMRLAA